MADSLNSLTGYDHLVGWERLFMMAAQAGLQPRIMRFSDSGASDILSPGGLLSALAAVGPNLSQPGLPGSGLHAAYLLHPELTSVGYACDGLYATAACAIGVTAPGQNLYLTVQGLAGAAPVQVFCSTSMATFQEMVMAVSARQYPAHTGPATGVSGRIKALWRPIKPSSPVIRPRRAPTLPRSRQGWSLRSASCPRIKRPFTCLLSARAHHRVSQFSRSRSLLRDYVSKVVRWTGEAHAKNQGCGGRKQRWRHRLSTKWTTARKKPIS